jgi:signal transduction histidine kinase
VAGSAGLAFGLAVCALSAPAQSSPWWLWAAPRLLAAGMIVAGARRWARTSAAASPLIGQLLIATGSTAYLADLRVSHSRILFEVGFCLAYLHTAFGAHLGLALPDGRLRGIARVLVPVTYVSSVLPQTVKFFAHRPRRATAELVLSRDMSTLSEVGSVTAVLVGLAVAGVLTWRLMTATTLLRRSYAPAWVAIILWSLLCTSVAGAALVRLPALTELWLVFTTFVLWLGTVAAAYCWTRAQDRRSRWRLATIALELERVDPGSRPPRLEQALAAAVGDPTLRLAYQVEADRWVDIDGRPTAALPNAGQLATPVGRNGRVVAMIIHDAMLRKNPELARVAAAAAGVAIEKVHLYATLRDQVSQIRRSRQRLATATIEERRRIQRDLHDGAQQRLFAASALLDLAKIHLEESTCDTVAIGAVRRAQSQLTDAVRELRELTFGIYPEALAEHGLSGALEALADRAPIPVRLDIAADRWSRPIEFTAYLVVAEALTNVYKHAGADKAAVTVAQHADRLVVSISDDGRGGATVGAGTGLSGLLDRVGAVGGTLHIESTTGAGTRLRTEIPLETG